MCGIVGYIGKRHALPIILDGLKRLEYRGYDSSGVAILTDDGLIVRRKKGKIKDLIEVVGHETINGTTGLGHTRWATHGKPSDENAHPHRAGDVVVIHNGIIENYTELRAMLKERGHHFKSETDTEIIAHLIEDHIKSGEPFEQAVLASVNQLRGSFALGVLYAKKPGQAHIRTGGKPPGAGVWQQREYLRLGHACNPAVHQQNAVYERRYHGRYHGRGR